MSNKYPGFEVLVAHESENDSGSRMINAAIYLFSKNGYTQTTTKSIAQLAGVSEALIFKRFSSKSNLLEVVFLEIIQKRVPEIFAYGVQNIQLPPNTQINIEALVPVFTSKFSYISKHAGYFKIVFQELEFNSEDALINVRQLLEGLLSQLEAYVILFQKAGHLRSDISPRTLLRSLSGMMNLLLVDKNILNTPLNIESEIKQILTLFLKGAGKNEPQ